MFESIFLDKARTFYERLPESEQQDIDRILHALELDPSGDTETTNLIALGAVGFGVYDDGRWEIVFRVLDDRFIEVAGISRIQS